MGMLLLNMKTTLHQFLVLFVILGAFASPVLGSHFRYGTMSYTEDILSFDTVAQTADVTISFTAAFRRNYPWGLYFNEEWAQKTNFDNPSASDFTRCTSGCTNEAAEGVNTDPFFDEPSETTDDRNVNGIPGEMFYIKFPAYNGNLGDCTAEGANCVAYENYITPCPTPFYCDIADANGCTDASCYTAEWNPSKCALSNGNDYSNGEDSCAAWTEMYGMYMGDGKSRTVDLTVEEMDFSCSDHYITMTGDSTCNSITGNYLLGSDTFTYTYGTASQDPYLIFFTGGNRVYECVYDVANGEPGLDENGVCVGGVNGAELSRLLNNNAEGRFRLEMEVWLKLDGNSSPQAFQIPVLPVARSANSQDFRVFQISAYDPDLDELVFKFGTSYQFGGITRSKSSQFPFSENLDNPGEKLATYSQYADHICTANTRQYRLNGTCPTDRTPYLFDGVEDHSFTSSVPGLVQWSTFYDYDDARPLPGGLYNMVVMIHDVPQTVAEADSYQRVGRTVNHMPANPRYRPQEFAYKVSIPLDFMLYLYNGPVSFCRKECKDNKDIDIECVLDGTCNGPNDNAYPGLSTFTDLDGIYGLQLPVYGLRDIYSYPVDGFASPYSGMDQSLARYSQMCTICGSGSSGFGTASNYSMCTPFAADGKCGQEIDGSLVPIEGSCLQNQPPTFDEESRINGLPNNPGVEVWRSVSDALAAAHPELNPFGNHPFYAGVDYQVPELTFYKGENISFYVTAIDTDDCAELKVESGGLPYVASSKVIEGVTVEGSSAKLSSQEYLTDYPEFPQGAKVRSLMTWPAPAGSDAYPLYDYRPSRSRACFYAFDKYLATNQPFYCVDLLIVDLPDTVPQVLVRFECKQLLEYEPITHRYCFDDRTQRYCSANTYEEYMWHHALYTINATGYGRLVVDGEVQQLVVPVSYNNYTDEFVEWEGGEIFYTEMYPTKCKTELYGTEGEGPNTTCCTLRIGQPCPELTHNAFVGLMDEVAVWDRSLDEEEAKNVLFKMPQNLPGRELAAPRGEQVCLEDERILYARWNNPCQTDDDISFSPDATCEESARMKTQEVCHEGNYESMVSYNAVPWEPPMIMSMQVETSEGTMDVEQFPLDGVSEVVISGVGFARSPFLRCAMVPPDPMGYNTPSPDTYCNPEAQTCGRPDYGYLPEAYPYPYEFIKPYSLPSGGQFYYADGTYSFEGSSQVVYTSAKTLHAWNDDQPYLFRSDLHHPSSPYLTTAWTDTFRTRENEIPPFSDYRPDETSEDEWYEGGKTPYPYGSYESVVCTAPPGAFPSDQFYFGVSNDGGNVGSPSKAVTFIEYVLKQSSTSFEVPDSLIEISDVFDKDFTLTFWFYAASSVSGTILSLGPNNQTRLYVNNSKMCMMLGGEDQGCSEDDALDQWHHIMIVRHEDGASLSWALDLNHLGTESATDCSPMTIGGAAGALIDEIKLFPGSISSEDYVAAGLMTKEIASESQAVLLLRFNNVELPRFLVNAKTDAKAQIPETMTLMPSASPWEPSIMYSINDVPFHRFSEYRAEVGVESTWTVKGFNFAKSPWLSCNFGLISSEHVSYPISVPQTLASNPSPRNVAEGFEGMPRPDGKETTISPYPVFTPLEADSLPATHLSDHEVTCVVDGMSPNDEIDGAYFTVTNNVSLNYGLASISDLALECNGKGFASNEDVTAIVGNPGGFGYTFAFWVFPYEMQKNADMVTVFSLQDLTNTTAMVKKAMIMYNGYQLVYMDDCMKEFMIPDMKHMPNEWHFVSFTVNEKDEATFTVDHDSVEFSTHSRPTPQSVLTICADYVATSNNTYEPSSFFKGLIDEVKMFNAALSEDEIARIRCEKEDPSEVPDLVSYQTFNVNTSTVSYFPTTSESEVGTPYMLSSVGLKASSAPWSPANVMYVTPEEGTGSGYGGSGLITVIGTNLAPSPMLHIGFDGVFAQYAGPTEGGAITVSAVDLEGCGGAYVFVEAANCAAKGGKMDSGLGAHWFADSNVANIGSGLLAHWTMDDRSGVVYEASMKTGRDMHIESQHMTADRDHFENAAVEFHDGFKVPMEEMLKDLKPVTICMWIYLPIIVGQTDKYEGAGAWKMVSYTKSMAEEIIYVNKKRASESSTEFMLPYMQTFLSSGLLFEGMSGKVDDIWVYERVLSLCEIGQRSATTEHAIDLARTDEIPYVKTSIPEGYEFTLESWVYPYHTEGLQTLYSIAADDSKDKESASEPSLTQWAFGLKDNYLTLSFYVGCVVEPCSSFLEATAARVLPNRWQHLAVSFNGTTAFFYVDGVFKQFVTFDRSIKSGKGHMDVNLLVGDELTQNEYMELFFDPVEKRPFAGLVYDLRITDGVKEHEEVKQDVPCPPKLPSKDEQYWNLNEGSFWSGGDGTFILPSDMIWRNASYDDPSDFTLTKVSGEAQYLAYDDNPAAQYVITSYTRCGKQRTVGGDDYTVTMVKGEWVGHATVTDTNDGNYHVMYNRTTLDACGVYESFLMAGETPVDYWTTVLAPTETNRSQTYTMEPVPEGRVLVPHRIVIQTVDNFGCNGTYAVDQFVAMISGPHNLNVTAVPGPEKGQFTVYWIPRSYGNYHISIHMLSGPDPGPLSHHCIDVGTGYAFPFMGTDSLVVEEETLVDTPPGTTDLDLTFPGLTIESWVYFKDTPTSDAYISFKGDISQVGKYIKGYELKYDANLETFVAAVYCGKGRVRDFQMKSIAGSIPTQMWMLVSVVYNSTSWVGYMDAQYVGSKSFDTSLPPQPNWYYHPMMLGYGLNGALNEFRMWKVARTQDELKADQSCGFISEGDEVVKEIAAYYSFNDDLASNPDISVSGFGDACWANSNPNCLRAFYVGSVSLGELEDARESMKDPQSTNQDPSAEASYMVNPEVVIAGEPAESWFPVYIRSACGFFYTDEEELDVSLSLQYMQGEHDDVSPLYFALSRPDPVCPDSPEENPEYRMGSVYNASMDITKAGYYQMSLALNGAAVSEGTLQVVHNVPASFMLMSPPSNPVSGQSHEFKVMLLDMYGNLVLEEMRIFALTFTLLGARYAKSQIFYAADESVEFDQGTYTFDISLCQSGSYVLDLVGELSYGITPMASAVTVDSGEWQVLDSQPDNSMLRFQHAGVSFDGDLYVFGGALYDKSYSNELLVAHVHDESSTEEALWEVVPTSGAVPSPRYAHSAVVKNDTMYVFGGQRSLYAYNEIYSFHFPSSTWNFISPSSAVAPSARFDHTAVMTEDGMVIYGGRNSSSKFLGDMWLFKFETQEWTQLADSTVAGARFGHSAAVPPGSSQMYVFGGYSDIGLSNQIYMCETTTGECTDYSYGCSSNSVMLTFVPETLTPRFGHTSAADSEFIYIYGGTTLTDTDGFHQLHKFSYNNCIWDVAEIDGRPLGRYDHVSWLTENGFYVQGGKSDGEYRQETLFLPVC